MSEMLERSERAWIGMLNEGRHDTRARKISGKELSLKISYLKGESGVLEEWPKL